MHGTVKKIGTKKSMGLLNRLPLSRAILFAEYNLPLLCDMLSGADVWYYTVIIKQV